MSESSPPVCPRCGAPVSHSLAEGLCPRCLLLMNLEQPTRLTGEETLPHTPPQPAPAPEELAPHFPQLEILECLGRGGMGVVYKARQKSLHRLVALKLLAPERTHDAAFTARFEREAQTLATLSHPHIVTVHDFGQAGGYFYLLMEFVDGVNLRQAMRASKFTPEQALALVPPICDALQYAHEHGVVHRDIKPENLLLDKEGRLKIADFGIAKIISSPSQPPTVGAPAQDPGTELHATLAGTPQYMAPEQGRDPASVDHRADIYSLGVVLYELLTGELPSATLEPPSSRLRHLHIDVRLDEVVLRALESRPELRYATAAEFRTVVETVTPSGTPPAPATATALPASLSYRSSRGRYTTPEFLSTAVGGFLKNQGLGTLTLRHDRLEFLTGEKREIIPFTALRQVGPARGPLWTSPSGHEYLSLLWEEAGRQRCLLFMEGTSLFRLASDTVAVVDEWATVIQDAVQASGLNPTLLVKKDTQVVPASPWLALLVLLPLLLVFLLVFRTNWAGSLLVLTVGIGAPLLFRQRRVTLGMSPAQAPTVVHPAGVAEGKPPTTGPAAALGFRSVSAARWLFLSQLGFLGFLGSVPGWERLWGFTGFFGFAGVAVISELLHRQANTSGPLRGWRKGILNIVFGVAIALPLRASVIQTFVLRGNSAAPELPAGSWVLVWRLSHSYAVGDMVVYKQGTLAFAGRLVKLDDAYIVVQRNGTGDHTVPRDLVIGKVIAQTRAAAPPAAATPLPPKSASSAATPQP